MILGILGGGQLGMLLCQAANKIGIDTFIYTDSYDSPATNYSKLSIIQPYDNKDSLNDFIQNCDVITFEFENIPYETLDYIIKSKPVFPNPGINKIIQDRLLEKDFINSLNIQTTKYIDVNSVKEIPENIFPSMLKTRRMGYDGKGQSVINSLKELSLINLNIPLILEKKINLLKEFSIIVTRYQNGQVFTYEPIENIHKNQILHTSKIPCSIEKNISNLALDQSINIANNLDYIGTMCVEFFLDKESNLYVNEVAPRVHNSGHLTIESYNCSQFESHIRAVCNIESKKPIKINNSEMLNLIGDDIKDYRDKKITKGHYFYDYEKKSIMDGRKMGHITKII